MPYKITIDYADAYDTDTYSWIDSVGVNLKNAIDFAKGELYKMQADAQYNVHCACVVDTENGLTLWSSNDSPEFEAALIRNQTGSNIQSEQPSVYFDIDGVLGKWYADARGYSSIEEIIDPRNHYFRDIEPHPAAIELAKRLCEKGADVCIISAADVNTIRDKWEWIDEHLPFIKKENIFFSPLGADKARYIKGNSECSLLIDDYNANLNAWNGKAMKAINTVNSHQDKYPEFDIAAAEIVMADPKDSVDDVAKEYIDRIGSLILTGMVNKDETKGISESLKTLWSNQIVDYINALVTNTNDYYHKRFKPSFTQEERRNLLTEESAVGAALNTVKYTIADAPSPVNEAREFTWGKEYTLSAVKNLIEKCKVDCYSEKAKEENPERYAVFVKAMDYISEKMSDAYKEKAEPKQHSPAKKVSGEIDRD